MNEVDQTNSEKLSPDSFRIFNQSSYEAVEMTPATSNQLERQWRSIHNRPVQEQEEHTLPNCLENNTPTRQNSDIAQCTFLDNPFSDHVSFQFNPNADEKDRTYKDEKGQTHVAKRRKCELSKAMKKPCPSILQGWADCSGRSSVVCKHSSCGVNLHKGCFQQWHYAKSKGMSP